MLDDLERITKLWKDGALTDAEFDAQKARLFATAPAAIPTENSDWENWEEPKPNKLVSYGAYALILAAAGGAAVLAYDYTSNDKQIISSIAKEAEATTGNETQEEPPLDEPPGDEPLEAAVPEVPAKPFVGHLTCTVRGQRYLVYTCLVGKDGMPGGSLKIRTQNGVKQYTENDIISTMQREEMIFDLTSNFEVNIQSGGDEFMTLRLDVKQDGKPVYSDETTGYGVINVSE